MLYYRFSRGCSTNTFVIKYLIHYFSQQSSSSQSSKHCLSQNNLRARELKLERTFTPNLVSHVMCHVSHVTCHVSCVTSHVSLSFIIFLNNLMELVGGGSVINRAYTVQFNFKLASLNCNISIQNIVSAVVKGTDTGQHSGTVE